VGLAIAVALSCTGNREVSFAIDISQSVAQKTTWFEIGAFSEGYCQAVKPVIASGIPLDGSAVRVAFRRDSPTPPALGDLKKGNYAFAAVARGQDCGVVASGCAEVDVASESEVVITMEPVQGNPGVCGANAKCSAGRCVPSNDNESVGAGCSLALLGAGPLGEAFAPSSEFVSGPAITAAPGGGFVIAYREADPEGLARLTLLPIDTGGGALQPLVSARLNGGLLRDYCAEAAPSQIDSAAFVLGAAGGTAVLSHPACGSIGGVDIFPTDPAGIITGFGRSGGQGVSLTLSQGHALYARPEGTPLLAYVANGQAELAAVTSSDLEAQERRAKFGGGVATGAWIAGDKTLAFLALGRGGGAPPPVDAGGDAARDAAPSPTPSTDTALRLKTSDDLTDLTKLTGAAAVDVAIDVPWGSVAVTGKRVLVLAPASSEGSPVDLHAFDGSRELETSPTSVAIDGIGDATSGDIAIAGDRAFIAVVRRGEVALVAMDRVTTNPTPFDPPRAVSFLRDTRIPSIAKVEDGKVAVATSGNRVAVVWTSASKIDINKPVGGYAVFACAP